MRVEGTQGKEVHGEGTETEREASQGAARHQCILTAVLAVLQSQTNDRPAQRKQAEPGGDREQGDEAQPEVGAVDQVVASILGHGLRHLR